MKAFLGANGLHGLGVTNWKEAVGDLDEFYLDDQSWRIRPRSRRGKLPHMSEDARFVGHDRELGVGRQEHDHQSHKG